MPRARCRADGGVDGRQKLIDAFWRLLATTNLRDITVGKVADEAQVNRGTFYYHYEDFDAFLSDVIERELLSDNSFASFMFDLVAGDRISPVIDLANDERTRKLCLAIERGDRSLVEEKVERAVMGMWQSVLHPDGKAMTPQTTLAIEYSISGMLGMISHSIKSAMQEGPRTSCEGPSFTRGSCLPTAFLHDLSGVMIREMSANEGISHEEILSRLRALREPVTPAPASH